MATQTKRPAKRSTKKKTPAKRAVKKAPAKRATNRQADFIERIEQMPLDDLKPHPRNYREHTPEQLAHLVQSIRDHGFYKNVVIAQDGTILAGHGATLAAGEVGLKTIPVFRVNLKPDSPQAWKIVAGDNEIANLAEVNDRRLTDMLRDIKEQDGNLLGTGFDDSILANLLMCTRSASEIRDIDEAAEWTGMPDFEAPPPLIKLVILFDNKEELEKLLKKLKIVVSGKLGNTTSGWYPPRPLDDTSAVIFDA
jgi:hypothetical protein